MLVRLPSNLDQLHRLRVLYLSHIALQALPASMQQLTNLVNLTLATNPLQFPPTSLADFDQLGVYVAADTSSPSCVRPLTVGKDHMPCITTFRSKSHK